VAQNAQKTNLLMTVISALIFFSKELIFVKTIFRWTDST